MPDFLMPSLGADMAAGTLVAWRVAPGQVVARGDIVAEVETEKGLIDIECFEPGTVEALHVAPGAKVQVGARMATIRSEGGAAPKASPPLPSPVTQTLTAGPDTGRRVRVSPAARARAQALGIDLAGIAGSGPSGAIELADIDRLAAVASPAAAGTVVAPDEGLAPIRRAIAAAMSRSKREIPHYYLQSRIDMNAALAWLRRENER